MFVGSFEERRDDGFTSVRPEIAHNMVDSVPYAARLHADGAVQHPVGDMDRAIELPAV